jgi:hypothetical protein
MLLLDFELLPLTGGRMPQCGSRYEGVSGPQGCGWHAERWRRKVENQG